MILSKESKKVVIHEIAMMMEDIVRINKFRRAEEVLDSILPVLEKGNEVQIHYTFTITEPMLAALVGRCQREEKIDYR